MPKYKSYLGINFFLNIPFTLTLAYLYCEFAFRTHFQCVVHMYDLKCVENGNQPVSTQGKVLEYSYVLGSVSMLPNQIAYLEKNPYRSVLTLLYVNLV